MNLVWVFTYLKKKMCKCLLFVSLLSKTAVSKKVSVDFRSSVTRTKWTVHVPLDDDPIVSTWRNKPYTVMSTQELDVILRKCVGNTTAFYLVFFLRTRLIISFPVLLCPRHLIYRILTCLKMKLKSANFVNCELSGISGRIKLTIINCTEFVNLKTNLDL